MIVFACILQKFCVKFLFMFVSSQLPKDIKLHLKTDKKDKDPKKEQKKDQKKRKKKVELTPKDKANVDALHAFTQKELDLHTWDAAKFARTSGQVAQSSASSSLYPQATTTVSFQQIQHQMQRSPTKNLMTSPLVSPNVSQEGSMLSSTSLSSTMHDSSFDGSHFVSLGGGPEVSLVFYCVYL